jgi:nucleoside-diphosphate-sugar epimerase
MKVLIIGGTGLMSTEITTQLLGRGDEVWHFNRGQTPARYSGAVIDMVAFHPDNTRAVLKALRGRMGQLRRES